MSAAVMLRIRRLDHARDLEPPAYQSAGAAGLDLVAAISDVQVIRPGERILIPTGLQLELPPGFEAQVRPRSGLALKHGLSVLNTPGTIDQDYRGEIKVLLINHGAQDFAVERGARIAQLVVAPVVQAQLLFTDDISATERGAGGFGSTGGMASNTGGSDLRAVKT